MYNLFVPLSTWLHSLATIVMVGYFFFTSLVFLPILERRIEPSGLRELLEHISARLRPYFGCSLLIFLVTGTHLMVISEHYLGLGNFTGNLWSIMIVIKHILVLVFLGLAVFSERTYLGQISDEKPEALKSFHLVLNFNTVLGVTILLLTSLAQAG